MPAERRDSDVENRTIEYDDLARTDGGETVAAGGGVVRKGSITDAEQVRSDLVLGSSIPRILWIRLPWLIVALVGGLAAGGVIEAFEDTLEAVVALAFFVPVIMDMGGNVGTQASTIFVRGLALGQIDDKTALKYTAREGLVGLIIGVIIGGIGGLFAVWWQGIPELGIVVFVGLVTVCVVASVVGYVIPWIAHKLGFDPAAASVPLITTVKDITALVIYFWLASILLAELL
ncbi:MAG: magnesium transporter [Halalkalicoccus sp.]